MKIILVKDMGSHPTTLNKQAQRQFSDCACDCACPTDGAARPVLSLPAAFYLELTPACNNRCPGCSNLYAEGRGTMPPSLTGAGWRALIAQIAPHTQHIKLTGGEPTLHPDFPAIVDTLSTYGISFAVFTNARWIEPERVLDTLCATPDCDGLLVSLHGPDAATHEAFSGVSGSFEETVVNIRRAVTAGLDVATSIVLTRYNFDRIAETLTMALSLGANHVVCNRWIGSPHLNLAPEPEQLRAAIAEVETLRTAGKPIRFGNCIPQCFEPSSSTGCTAGATFATIDPWGRVRPCNHAPLIAGDLHTQSLEEIWHGPVMQRWRDLVPAGCAACPAFTSCHGGCRAQASLSGAEQDLLIQEIYPKALPETGVTLWAGLRPVGRFTEQIAQGQRVLLHKSQVAIAPPAFYALLAQLDGSLTLEQIQAGYGGAALDWVGGLAQAGLVSWKTESYP